MKIFSLVGWSESGKTTLISALISHFKQKKKKIAALKNVSHRYSLQPEGKDTWEFLQAGADMVFLTSKDEIVLMKKRKPTIDLLTELNLELKNVDLVLLEGLTGENVPVIEVFSSKSNKNLKFQENKLAAVVADQKMDLEIPCFDINDIQQIAKFMEEFNGK